MDPPKCQNISFELNVSQTFKKDLKEFFDRKENIKYSLKFEILPFEYGN